jgi:amidophosphoribosyltransferase
MLISSHAHIYGVNLASPFELVAHKRDAVAIAKHIGADKLVYQTLEDLRAACAEITIQNGRTDPTDFEVGVFSGNYITPVNGCYFEHLEHIRGEARKLKVMDKAREAILSGIAGRREFEIAQNGVQLDHKGKVVPAFSSRDSDVPIVSISQASDAQAHTNHHINGSHPKVKDCMDVSIHNLGDFY